MCIFSPEFRVWAMAVSITITTNAARVGARIRKEGVSGVRAAWRRSARAEAGEVRKDIASAYRRGLRSRKPAFPLRELRVVIRGGRGSALPTYAVESKSGVDEILRRGLMGGVKRPTRARYLFIPFKAAGARRMPSGARVGSNGVVFRRGRPIGVLRREARYAPWFSLLAVQVKARARFRRRFLHELRREFGRRLR